MLLIPKARIENDAFLLKVQLFRVSEKLGFAGSGGEVVVVLDF